MAFTNVSNVQSSCPIMLNDGEVKGHIRNTTTTRPHERSKNIKRLLLHERSWD